MAGILFQDAYELIPLGAVVSVTNGEPEPAKDSPHYACWLSRNPTGLLVEKLTDPPRMVIRLPDKVLPGGHSAQVSFTVEDGPTILVEQRMESAQAIGRFKQVDAGPQKWVKPKTLAQIETLTQGNAKKWEKAQRKASAPRGAYAVVSQCEDRMYRVLSTLWPEKFAALTPKQLEELFPSLDFE